VHEGKRAPLQGKKAPLVVKWLKKPQMSVERMSHARKDWINGVHRDEAVEGDD